MVAGKGGWHIRQMLYYITKGNKVHTIVHVCLVYESNDANVNAIRIHFKVEMRNANNPVKRWL